MTTAFDGGFGDPVVGGIKTVVHDLDQASTRKAHVVVRDQSRHAVPPCDLVDFFFNRAGIGVDQHPGAVVWLVFRALSLSVVTRAGSVEELGSKRAAGLEGPAPICLLAIMSARRIWSRCSTPRSPSALGVVKGPAKMTKSAPRASAEMSSPLSIPESQMIGTSSPAAARMREGRWVPVRLRTDGRYGC